MSYRCRLTTVVAVGLIAGAAALGYHATETREASAQEPPAVRDELPVRGLHVSVWGSVDVDLCEKFIREALPAEGVNVLVLEVGYNYAYTSYPQVAHEGGLSKGDVQRLLAACREAGVKLIPQINCFGHQSWGARSHGLLRAFPEFDESPHIPQDAGRREIYCRSYCPLHPEVHEVVFSLIDELADAFEATDCHVGLDEVFVIAEENCPRCGGKDPAELFAGEVKALHGNLAGKGRTMWMWGDRLIDGEEMGIGRWEASLGGTHPALDMVPKDIIICDWHYDRAPQTPAYFLEKGFGVVACPWRKEEVALEQLEMIRELRKENDRALGMLQTTWCGFERFVRAYNGELDAEERRNRSAVEAARCFKTLFAAIRGEDPD
ncbi:MAG: family 20 glycosylhydrolase [Candidatus Brocadiae bacterium]|nr:family 20 glycosylhydrolase [Candidatus Brocadiia bacterium]